MKQYINEIGKEAWCGVENSTPMSDLQFHRVPLSACLDDDQQWALHTNLGSLTVLERMTGFGYRDVETGYRDVEGKFWLASGNYDVRYAGVATIGEAIEWVKTYANTCIPDAKK